jgi:deoxyinosine 3'endonuclease (endonuclease V)
LDAVETHVYEETLTDIAPYVSGQFYKRELPCILSLLQQIDLKHCKAIVIDGFVVLDDKGGKGLGGYLYERLKKKIPVIGVAKNDFSKDFNSKRAIQRGNSKKPLFVTAMGMDVHTAARHIETMHGKFRIPTLLKKVDSLGRA